MEGANGPGDPLKGVASDRGFLVGRFPDPSKKKTLQSHRVDSLGGLCGLVLLEKVYGGVDSKSRTDSNLTKLFS